MTTAAPPATLIHILILLSSLFFQAKMSEQSGGAVGMQKGKQKLEGARMESRKVKGGRAEGALRSLQLPVKSRSSNFLLSQRLLVF